MTDDDPPEYELFADGPGYWTADDFKFDSITTSTLHIDFEAITAESVELENVTPEVYDELDATPNEDLRALMEDFRENARDAPKGTLGNVGKLTYNECADKLERLIEDESND